jgi:magnesium transporter
MAQMRRSEKSGMLPGSPVYIGKKAQGTEITLIDYDESQLREKKIADVKECLPFKEKPSVTWVDVDGLGDVEKLVELGKVFGLHPLIVEDILNTEQRPKFEDQGDYIFIVLRMLGTGTKGNKKTDDGAQKDGHMDSEQVSIILGKNFVISFQERREDSFDPVRERIRNGKGRIRKLGSDYLAYSLIDAIVDNYFVLLENLGEGIESMEDGLVTDPNPRTLHALHVMKRRMIELRKSIWPLREVLSSLDRADTGRSALIKPETRIYMRDVYDHTIQIIDTVETYRDMLSGMLDIYLSSVSIRLNEVMKVLTIVGTIFMPLTFIVGIYGMNFKDMPELGMPYGYPIVLGLMFILALGMLAYFRNKKWI